MVYSVGKDIPSKDALRELSGLPAGKVVWLQRRDRESGDLDGMLPVIHKMLVARTDHIDRNPGKRLLRGRAGFVHSWVVPESKVSAMDEPAAHHGRSTRILQIPRRRVDAARLHRVRALSHHDAERHLVAGQRSEASGVEDHAAPNTFSSSLRDGCTRCPRSDRARHQCYCQPRGVDARAEPRRSAHLQAILPQALRACGPEGPELLLKALRGLGCY